MPVSPGQTVNSDEDGGGRDMLRSSKQNIAEDLFGDQFLFLASELFS